ncbi:MAG: hypothetical protein ACR2FM_05030 [Candidatus Saccharimonadales bacterium]
MAFKFSDEDKEVREFTESIPFGVHEVQFTGADAGETDAGKDFIEIGVVTKDGIEDSARLWFVGGASGISFNTAHAIAVHQGKDDKEKADIRDRIEAVADSQELVDVLNDVCASGKLWFSKYFDPKRTYQNQSGETRQSINKSVYGYEPKEKLELMNTPKENVDKVFPGNEKVDASSTVPSDGDWAK